MKWMNAGVLEIATRPDGGLNIVAELRPKDKNFKKTRKVNWLLDDPEYLTAVRVIELDHLINVKKVE